MSVYFQIKNGFSSQTGIKKENISDKLHILFFSIEIFKIMN